MAFVNEILAKNLSYIKKYDLELCKKLEEVESISPEIQMIYTNLNEPNLAINGEPISSQSGAQAEADSKVQTFSNNNSQSIHIIFGTGFGYIFKRAAEISKGTVILYEPNLDLLRIMLEMVDFTDILVSSRVYITNTLSMLEKHFCASFVPGSRSSLAFTNYHRNCLKPEFDELLKKLGVLQGMLETNENQRIKMGFGYAKDVARNLPLLSKCNSINVLKDSLKDIPAVIAAAGPSLSDNLEVIKKQRSKFVLFSVSTSYASLVKSDITPDFVSMIERFDAINFVKDYSPEKVCLIAEPYVNQSVLKCNFKNKFITASLENTANKIYEKACSLPNEAFETKGTVAYNALFTAKFAGCNPIILVGQDLAYVDGECYSKNSPLSEFKCRKTQSGWEVYVENREQLIKNLYGHIAIADETKYEAEIDRKTKELNKQLAVTKTLAGKECVTSLTFALFAEYYKLFSRDFSSKVELYTVSQKGADIGNFKYCPLENILSKYQEIDKNAVNAVLNIKSRPQVDIDFLKKELILLTNAAEEIQINRSHYEKLGERLKKGKIDADILVLIKTLLGCYSLIREKFSQKSLIFNEITMTSKAAMATIMANNLGLDFDSINLIYNALGDFFNIDAGRIRFLIGVLTNTIRSIENEISCTAC